MTSPIAELDLISQQFKSLDRSKKSKMLVVDDEPDNLDLLYRTFRRDFTVLRAESGIVALEILAKEGEVAVIISDQRMPEMKGTEFLSRTVPQFPDTMRIILTGFTDVEDLVEAINSGQVYKYITKPWDPVELKGVVQRAVEAYDLLKQRTEELRYAQTQTALLAAIVDATYNSVSLEACLQKIATAYGTNFVADACILQMVENMNLGMQGKYEGANPALLLTQDTLVEKAINTQAIQAVVLNAVPDPSSWQQYVDAGIQSHLVIPIPFRDEALAVLSLQWQNSYALSAEELEIISLAAQQVGMAITCNRYRMAA